MLWVICKATTMLFDTLYCMQYDPELRVAAKLLPELSSLTDNDTLRHQLLQAIICFMKHAWQIKLQLRDYDMWPQELDVSHYRHEHHSNNALHVFAKLP